MKDTKNMTLIFIYFTGVTHQQKMSNGMINP